MAETITMTVPVVGPTLTTIRVERVTIDLERGTIYIQWLFNDGSPGSAVYPTPPPTNNPAQPSGATLISQLNTANLSTTSLVKRILQRLQTDGYLAAGVVVGTPS